VYNYYAINTKTGSSGAAILPIVSREMCADKLVVDTVRSSDLVASFSTLSDDPVGGFTMKEITGLKLKRKKAVIQ